MYPKYLTNSIQPWLKLDIMPSKRKNPYGLGRGGVLVFNPVPAKASGRKFGSAVMVSAPGSRPSGSHTGGVRSGSPLRLTTLDDSENRRVHFYRPRASERRGFRIVKVATSRGQMEGFHAKWGRHRLQALRRHPHRAYPRLQRQRVAFLRKAC